MTGPGKTREPILDDPEPEPILDSRELPPNLLTLWSLLANGGKYTNKQLVELMSDECGPRKFREKVHLLRKYLRPRGLDVMVWYRVGYAEYQLVRLINKGE